ncbi:unnamed protein product [Brassica napus]|uniref:RNA-dependent RNA polymerase n=1 Tax=Brassica napus TaxID=3708 RepID=A0A816Y6C0_BRANA|nr:unnamed protein product [Brassica napus]
MITASTSQRSVIALPARLETVLEKIYSKHKCPPINDESRQRLSSIPEEIAFDLLRKAFNAPGMSNLDHFILSKLTHAVTVTSSPAKSPPPKDGCRVSQEEISVDSEAPPQLLLALSELEFNKAFLLLTYIPRKDLSQVEITAEEIRGWKDLSMVAFEAAVWDSLGNKFCSPTDRRLSLECDNEKTSYYQCHVASDGSYTFKVFSPLFNYYLLSCFAYIPNSCSLCALIFFHLFQLQDQNNNDVLDKNGKPCIHSDGTGYISEDLARMCPVNVYKGKCLRSNNVQTPAQNPVCILNFKPMFMLPYILVHSNSYFSKQPLLIQFRMFYDGYAAKGTFLLNKKLPPRTVQVRPSMIMVSKDPALSNVSTFGSLEVVNTRNPPKRTKLSRNLVALLSYGGVPDEFFLDILLNTLEESKTIFNNKRAALKVALNYGDMDDHNAARMILAGIPLDEPHLQDQLSIFSKTEKNDLKAGRLPVSESYYLMGTVDPTGELKEDEVCVILESGQISGNVLVYRNPGLHFGDIHVLKATYVKALEEYVGNSKYGVFFPQKGPRSLGDEIAGDLYFISRNPELLEHFKPSEPWVSSTPININSAKNPSQLSPEELEEMLFNMYLKTRFHASNVVGMAADSWLTIMDQFLTLGDERAEEKAEMKKKMLKLIDIYYDALDAPKQGAEVVNLPDELKPDIFPHYLERDQKFNSTSILGMIYDFVHSHTAEEHKPSAEISKLACFEDEPVSDYHKKKWGRLYEKYRKEMIQAMGNKDESANEVIQRYKQASSSMNLMDHEFYGAAGLEELYPQALALYNIVYDHAVKMNNARNCGFVWKVAGPVLCRFYLEKTEEKSLVCPLGVFKKVLLG